jgi:predicted PurR-regulated permease PerM
MSPPGAMLAAFIGAAIAGIPGALVATPLVGAAKLMYTDVRYGTDTSDDARPDSKVTTLLRRIFRSRSRSR